MKPQLFVRYRWMGDSKKQMQAFPNQAQKDMGEALQTIQFGGVPKMAKPFKGCGAGIFELVYPFDTDTYRTVVAVKIGEENLRLRCLYEKVEERHRNAEIYC